MEQKMIKKQEVELDLITLKAAKIPYSFKEGDTNVHEITLKLNAEEGFGFEKARVHYSNGDYQDIEGLTFIIKNSALETGGRNFEVEFISGSAVRRSGKVEYRVDRSINSEYEAYDKYSELKKLYDLYVELKGGEGGTGSISNLSAEDIETALGFMPVHPVGGVTTKRKEIGVMHLLDTPDSEINIDLSVSNTIVVMIGANNVVVNFDNVNTTPNTNDTVRMVYSNFNGFDAYLNHEATIDGGWYDTFNMYRFPSGMGVIEFNFVNLEFEGQAETTAFGTTGGTDVNLDDIDARSLNGYTQSDFVLTIHHGTDENRYRPWNAGVVMWVGTVEPRNARDNDIWIGG